MAGSGRWWRRLIGGTGPAGWPRGLLGMVALVAAIEGMVGIREDGLTSMGTFAWRYSMQAARREARNHAILCLGSSLIKCGILPRVVGHETGRNCFNLAVGNGRTVSSYYVLKHALDAGARPAAILVDCLDGPGRSIAASEALEEALETNLRNWPELLTLRDSAEIAATARKPDFLAAIVLSRVLPSYRTRFEIRAAAWAIIHGEPVDNLSLKLRVAKRNWDFNRGTFVRDPGDPRPTPGLMAEPAEAAGGPGPAPGPRGSESLSEVYARRLLELSRAHGITVFWLLPPIYPPVQAERVRDRSDAYFTRVARDAMASFPNVVVVDGRGSGYPGSSFPDRLHLGPLGSYAFTADVADVVRRHLAAPGSAPRWCTLPRYRERPMELPVESIKDSLRAVLWADYARSRGTPGDPDLTARGPRAASRPSPPPG